MKSALIALLLAMSFWPSWPAAQAADAQGAFEMPAPGSVSKAQGLAAWQRIEAVVTHPRCTNCHVGPDNVPRWANGSQDQARPHGMGINAGPSRKGRETVPCSRCHATSTAPNIYSHIPPHVGVPWQLAPVEFAWFGKSGAEICAQLRDPRRNGGRDSAGLVEHLRQDALANGFIPWAWNPGGGREAPPGTFEDHVKDVATWGAAGQPCP